LFTPNPVDQGKWQRAADVHQGTRSDAPGAGKGTDVAADAGALVTTEPDGEMSIS